MWVICQKDFFKLALILLMMSYISMCNYSDIIVLSQVNISMKSWICKHIMGTAFSFPLIDNDYSMLLLCSLCASVYKKLGKAHCMLTRKWMVKINALARTENSNSVSNIFCHLFKASFAWDEWIVTGHWGQPFLITYQISSTLSPIILCSFQHLNA